MDILLVIVLVALAVLLLSVRVVLKKNGAFSSQHISQSQAMRERGIHCINTQDREARRDNPNKVDVKNV